MKSSVKKYFLLMMVVSVSFSSLPPSVSSEREARSSSGDSSSSGRLRSPEDSLSARVDSMLALCVAADEMPAADLRPALLKCEKLVGIVEKSNHPKRRLYLFRLRKCCRYIAYIIEIKARTGSARRR